MKNRTISVLCADDDPISLRLVSSMVKNTGLEVITAKDGTEAAEILMGANPPLIAIIDWMMPGKNGPELCTLVRELNREVYTYILLLTGKAEKEDLVFGLSSGADDYLIKPVSVGELRARLKTAVRLVTAQSELRDKSLLLEEAHSQNSVVLDSIPSAILCIDLNDHVIKWNQNAVNLFGIESSLAQKKNFLSLGLKWDWETILSSIVQSREGRRQIGVECVSFIKPNGELGYLRLNIAPLGLSGDSYTGTMLIVDDITDQKNLEKSLAQSRQLESFGQLAAGIAHEINSPLQYVKTNLTFAEDALSRLAPLLNSIENRAERISMSEQEHAELVALAKKSKLSYINKELPPAIAQSVQGIDRMSEIIKTMRLLTHKGSRTLSTESVNTIIESSLEITRHQWKNEAEMKLMLDPELPLVKAHPGELSQVFINLVVNAAQAIEDAKKQFPDRRGEITVSTGSSHDGIFINIQDNGVGIPEKNLERIFNPFFTTKEVGRGTGQGLSIVHSIVVTKHCGRIDVVSKVGQGTTIRIWLPLDPEKGRSSEGDKRISATTSTHIS